jgi:hypothetical protein
MKDEVRALLWELKPVDSQRTGNETIVRTIDVDRRGARMQSAMPSSSTTVRTKCPCHRDMSRNRGEEAVGQRERKE